MKVKIIILATIMMMMFWTKSVLGYEEPGIHGSVSFKYELAGVAGQSWMIDLHYQFCKWFNAGVSEVTNTNGYNTYFDFIPAFIPYSQLYEAYVTIMPTKNISIKLSQWCLHPVYSGDPINFDVKQGFYIEGKYQF